MTTRNTGWAVVVTGLLTIVAIYFLVPVYWVIVAATKSSGDLFTTPGFWFGRTMQLWHNVVEVFTASDGIYLRWLLNSVIYAGVGALVATYLAAAGGYAIAKYDFPGRNLVFGTVLGGVLVPSTATALPLFLLFSKLGLTNTYWGLILPQIATSVAFGTFWMRAFFRGVPRSLVEAARIDGASSWFTLWRVLLPLARPAVLTMTVLLFMWTWNEFLLALVMVSDEGLRTAPLGLAFFSGRNTTDFALLAAGSVIVATPVVVLYVFLQRHFIRGMLSGAVKG